MPGPLPIIKHSMYPRPVSIQQLEKRRTLYRELAARHFRLETRLDRTGAADAPTLAIRTEISGLRQDLDQIDARIGKASQTARSRRGAARRPASLQFSANTIGVAVIEYWLGVSDSYAWVITRKGVTMSRLGATPPSNRMQPPCTPPCVTSAGHPELNGSPPAERLYSLILAPVKPQIAGMQTLIFAPDGALHYVPFATLRLMDAGRTAFLVEKYDIAVTPSIQMFPDRIPRLAAARPKQMLLVDDPVYDSADPRVRNPSGPLPDADLPTVTQRLALVRGGGPHLPRLPGAAAEAAAIVSLMPAGSVDRLNGFAANRERFLNSSLENYRVDPRRLARNDRCRNSTGLGLDSQHRGWRREERRRARICGRLPSACGSTPTLLC